MDDKKVALEKIKQHAESLVNYALETNDNVVMTKNFNTLMGMRLVLRELGELDTATEISCLINKLT